MKQKICITIDQNTYNELQKKMVSESHRSMSAMIEDMINIGISSDNEIIKNQKQIKRQLASLHKKLGEIPR